MEPQSAKLAVGAAAGAVQEAKGLIGRFLGPACDEIGGYLADNVRLFRLKNELRVLRKAVDILEGEGLTPRAVNLKTLVPLLDAAALEEEDSMGDRWAALLATAADPRALDPVSPSFVEILKQLSPSEAQVLDLIYHAINELGIRRDEWKSRGIIAQSVRIHLRLEPTSFQVAVDNLLRLRLLAPPSVSLDFIDHRQHLFQLSNGHLLCGTDLGFAFTTACRRGTKPSAAAKLASESEPDVKHTINHLSTWQ